MGALVLYDGVCALCNGAVRFVIRHDSAAHFRFAPLQGTTARAVLERHGRVEDGFDSMVVVLDLDTRSERLLERSAALRYVLRALGGPWRVLALLLGLVPRALLDWAYDRLARSRYRVAGRLETCPLPLPEERERFLAD